MTAEEANNAFENAVADLPNYFSTLEGSSDLGKSIHGWNLNQKPREEKHRKGIPWTEEEHRNRGARRLYLGFEGSAQSRTRGGLSFLGQRLRASNPPRLFLDGLEKYGKGDWRGISRDFVKTKIPAQVMSHAQKYFIRLNSKNNEKSQSMKKGKGRKSIHDIPHFRAGDLAAAQGPITDQTNGPELTSGPLLLEAAMKYSQPLTIPPGGHDEIFSAFDHFSAFDVGTPISLLVPDASHMAYWFPAPVTGLVVPDGPVALLEDYWCFCCDSCLLFCA